MVSSVKPQIMVQVITEFEEKYRHDIESLSSVPGIHAVAESPLSFVLSLHSLSFGTVAVLELPFVQENEKEFIGLVNSAAQRPIVIVTDEPLKYLSYAGRGTVQIVMREPGYTNHLPDAVRAAYEASTLITERDTLEKRLHEYAQYLETINKIMEHDIGDMNQAILTFSELLRGTASPANRKIIDNILGQSKTVGNLINSFSKLAQLARGSIEDLTVKPQDMALAVSEGVSRFGGENGRRVQSATHLQDGLSVVADMHLSDLFEHAISFVANMNPAFSRFDVNAREGLTLNRSVVVTISPEGLPPNLIPKSMAHVDDMDTLLRGNADLMAVIMLSRRYGGSVSIGVTEFSGKDCNFLTILLPSAV